MCDHNPGKVVSVREALGVEMDFVNPYLLPRGARLRIRMLWALLARQHTREVVWATILSECVANVYQTISPSQRRIFVWNPYNLLHYAIAFRFPVSAAYHLSCGYPPLKQVNVAIGSEFVLTTIGYPMEVKRAFVGPEIRSKGLGQRLVLCPSKREVFGRCRTERMLFEIAVGVQSQTGADVWVFVHPNDSGDEGVLAEIRELGGDKPFSVSTERYIEARWSDDVSLTGISTLGAELVSRKVNHLVLVDGVPHDGEMRGDWRIRAWEDLRDRNALLDVRGGVEQCVREVVERLKEQFDRNVRVRDSGSYLRGDQR